MNLRFAKGVNMDNQEHLQAVSRDEYIRLARESCTRNLGPNGSYKNHGGNKNKGYLNNDKMRTWDNAEEYHKSDFADTGLNMVPVNIKSLLIRVICAMLLFLTVFIIDKFDFKTKTFDSNHIKQLVSSNQTIDEAEDFVISLYKKIVKNDDK
jgi:hypothetical protein